MAALTGKTPASTYKDLLQVSNSNSGIDGTLRALSDGEGTASILSLSTTAVSMDSNTLYVDAGNSRVGINDDSPSNQLWVKGTTVDAVDSAIVDQYNLGLFTDDGATGDEIGLCFLLRTSAGGSASTPGAAITHERTGNNSQGALHFKTKQGTGSTSDCVTGMTLTEDGDFLVDIDTLFVDASLDRVGIGTTSPDGPFHIFSGSAGAISPAVGADDLVVEHSGQCGLTFLTGVSAGTTIAFADTDSAIIGQIYYDHSSDYMNFVAGGTAAFRLSASEVYVGSGLDFYVDTDTLFVDAGNDRVGINDSTPETTLTMGNGTLSIKNSNTDSSGLKIFQAASDVSTIHNNFSGSLEMGVGNTTYLTIDSGGVINFGTHTSIGAETVTGYITMKDSGGTSRKIAVVS